MDGGGYGMRNYKIIDSGYIISVGTGNGGTEISEQEYAEILAIIRNKPTPRDGYDYRLKTDLTWEEYELPPMPDPADEDITDSEVLDIILGGERE